MRVDISIPFHLSVDKALYLVSSNPSIQEQVALEPRYGSRDCIGSIDLPAHSLNLSYHFLEASTSSSSSSHRVDFGEHTFTLELSPYVTHLTIKDHWQNIPFEPVLFEPIFYRELLGIHKIQALEIQPRRRYICLDMPYLKTGDKPFLVGEGGALGNWQICSKNAFCYQGRGIWLFELEHEIPSRLEFKIVIKTAHGEVYWEEGSNRVIECHKLKLEEAELIALGKIDNFSYRPSFEGIAIPLFSLRGKDAWGIGTLSALKELFRWCLLKGLQVVQLLPIYDTLCHWDWRDSYPYNAISTKALHPLYLSLEEFHPSRADYLALKELEELDHVDYPRVARLKWQIFLNFFDRNKEGLSQNLQFRDFIEKNSSWLKAYCQFRYECDQKLLSEAPFNKRVYTQEEYTLFISYLQYRLHTDLLDVVTYAHELGIALKGDLPIGVNPIGVEVQETPAYFHLDLSAGAPPDAFAHDGQNWGFPTYNWDQMKQDGYAWWHQRLQQMSQYFDLVRIDHVLGFFRIWSIPTSQRSGLLGYFSPSKPYSRDYWEALLPAPWSVDLLSKPLIARADLDQLFGLEKVEELIQKKELLESTLEGYYHLRCHQQVDYLSLIEQYSEKESLYRTLYQLTTEVALIKDPRGEYYHPRVFFEWSRLYQHFSEPLQSDWLHWSYRYFYQDNEQLWGEAGRQQLGAIKKQSQMLLCAEDLGFLSPIVTTVIDELALLHLEIERMPKAMGALWQSPKEAPYRAVLATSTHDMPPLALWWRALPAELKRQYLNHIHCWDAVPGDESLVFSKILESYREATSLFKILPLGDFLATHLLMQTPGAEKQINDPSNPYHHWDYRFPFSIEQLISGSKD